MGDEAKLRERALELARQDLDRGRDKIRAEPAEIVARAEHYLAFLTGRSPLATGHPLADAAADLRFLGSMPVMREWSES